METRDQIRAKVEQQFDLELAAIRRLDETSDGLLDLLPQQGLQTEGDRILAMAVARGMTTFKAVLSLIEEGFGREALMLNRSMFEGAAVAYWVSSNQEKAAEHFALATQPTAPRSPQEREARGGSARFQRTDDKPNPSSAANALAHPDVGLLSPKPQVPPVQRKQLRAPQARCCKQVEHQAMHRRNERDHQLHRLAGKRSCALLVFGFGSMWKHRLTRRVVPNQPLPSR